MSESGGDGKVNGDAQEDIRDVEGYQIGGIVESGMTADGHVVLLVRVGEDAMALAFEPDDAERAAGMLLTHVPTAPAEAVEISLSSATGASGAVDATGAGATAPEGSEELFTFQFDGKDGPATIRLPAANALHFSRKLAESLAEFYARKAKEKAAGAG